MKNLEINGQGSQCRSSVKIKVLTPVVGSFATAQPQQSGLDGSIQLPQAIAHRGYKAAFAENTLRAFSAAVDIGAHAIETDIHLSRDKVVVLSHVSENHGGLIRHHKRC
jgi:glycerophosphoryl diester phosphodiesterase